MNLTVLERLVVLDLLPSRGNVSTMRLAQSVRRKVALSEEEEKKWDVVFSERGVSIPPEYQGVETEVELNLPERSLIRDRLTELDGKQQLSVNHLGVWERFQTLSEVE